jgi:exodeoxyribonuclease VII small subunit
MAKEKLTKLDFETAYHRLSETAAKLEAGKLSLEESLALYEEGVILARHCEMLLNNAELRVTQLANTPENSPSPAKARQTLFDDEDF